MWTRIVSFFNANKVFILGLLSAIAVVLQQFLGTSAIDWLAVGYAVGIAILSFIANQWRGQGMTILGIIGTLAYVFSQNIAIGVPLNWGNILMLSLTAILSALAPPPKNTSYEKSTVIEQAKKL